MLPPVVSPRTISWRGCCSTIDSSIHASDFHRSCPLETDWVTKHWARHFWWLQAILWELRVNLGTWLLHLGSSICHMLPHVWFIGRVNTRKLLRGVRMSAETRLSIFGRCVFFCEMATSFATLKSSCLKACPTFLSKKRYTRSGSHVLLLQVGFLRLPSLTSQAFSKLRHDELALASATIWIKSGQWEL